MSVLGDVLDLLGETIVPEVAAIVFPDSCIVQRLVETKDSGGAVITDWEDVNYYAMPCVVEPKNRTALDNSEVGGKWVSFTTYEITLPTHQEWGVVDIRTNDRIIVQARGSQLERTYRIMTIKNESGVDLIAICNLENLTTV